MLRLTIKNLAANRLRFALTTFAVVLAVSFVVSSFVLTDGLRSSFDDLSGEIVGGTDYEVRPQAGFGTDNQLAESVLDDVARIDGIAAAAPVVEAENLIRPLNALGEQISTSGPPQLAFGWVDDDRLIRFTLVEGEAPDAAREFTMDLDAAAKHGFSVNETYDVVTPSGLTQLTLTGLVSFGENNDTLGATLMQLDVDWLQRLLGQRGYDSIVVAVADDSDRATVEAQLVSASSGAEVVDNTTLESEMQADFNSDIDIIGNILLGFAGVSLFVSIFIIYNTFAIVLGQRTKELALLRTVGADPKQLRRSVLAEAGLIGVLASAVGVGAGVGVAFGLRALFDAIGITLPDSPVIISTRTVLVAAVVGIGATVISAIGPARKASRVPAIAALRDGVDAGAVSHRMRFAIGSLLTVVGLGAGATGLFIASSTTGIIAMLALGAIGVFVGVTMLSPLVASPLTWVLGWPARRVAGVSGRLAQQNAGRNPQRTATTAAALMIGLALVSMALTVGESVKAQLRSTLETSVSAEYLVVPDEEDGFSTTPAGVLERLDALPEVGPITRFRYDDVIVGDGIYTVASTDFAAADTLFDFGIVDGHSIDASVSDPLLISDEHAASEDLAVGDLVHMEFRSGQVRDLTIIGIYSDDIVLDDRYLIDLSTWNSAHNTQTDDWLAFSLADGVTQEAAALAFEPIEADFPLVQISTANDYVKTLEGLVDQALAAVNVMVALAVIIALIGIANTLALSVFERTKELGLLRAVGMSRRQLRRMVRFEAALVALFGAAMGVGLGVLFGWAAVVALPNSVSSTLAVPVVRIVLLVTVAGLAGLVAAWGPARRAGRLDVLGAISS